MTLHITRETWDAYEAYLNEPIDAFVDGKPVLRRNTYPHSHGGNCIVEFAAGWQAREKAVPDDKTILDWLEQNHAIEIGTSDGDGELLRTIYIREGSRNDREWREIAEASTLRAALTQAMKVKT